MFPLLLLWNFSGILILHTELYFMFNSLKIVLNLFNPLNAHVSKLKLTEHKAYIL